MSKRRKGYPSETRVKRGRRVVHGDKELVEKLGRRPLPVRIGPVLSGAAACAGAALAGSLRHLYFRQ